jgi:hypothetical protein
VGRDSEHLAALRNEMAFGLLARLGLAARDDDARPRGDEALGDREADAGGASGHDGDNSRITPGANVGDEHLERPLPGDVVAVIERHFELVVIHVELRAPVDEEAHPPRNTGDSSMSQVGTNPGGSSPDVVATTSSGILK